jgi:hypothetical protein
MGGYGWPDLEIVQVEVSRYLHHRIERLGKAGYSLSSILEAGVRLLEFEWFKRECKLMREEQPFEYRWPNGEVTLFEKALHFTVMELPAERTVPYIIAYGFREAYGSKRRLVVVFRRVRMIELGEEEVFLPIVDFFGTDEWLYTKLVASPIRGGRLWKSHPFKIGEELPDDYEVLEPFIRDYGEVVRGGERGYAALVIREDDYARILYHAMIRYRLRGILSFEGPYYEGLVERWCADVAFI